MKDQFAAPMPMNPKRILLGSIRVLLLGLLLYALQTVVTSVSPITEIQAKASSTSKKFKRKKFKTKRRAIKRRKRRRRTRRRGKPYNPLYAFIVVDAASGKVLSSFNADAKTYPASLTKMMTAYLVFEKLEQGKMKLHQRLRVSRHAARQMAGKLWLKSKSTISLKNALYATIIKSANDAAVVLAEAVGKTESNFAHLMTKKARQLGMYRTFFKNASGVPNVRQVTTARDMMILARALYHRFPQYYHIFGNKTFTYKKRTYKNTNKLLGRVKGLDGIKTGYIRLSGFNLAASAKRGGRRIIAVVMGGKTRRWRDQQMTRLINSTFNSMNLTPPKPLPKPLRFRKGSEESSVDKTPKEEEPMSAPSAPEEGLKGLPDKKLEQLKRETFEAELKEMDEMEEFVVPDEDDENDFDDEAETDEEEDVLESPSKDSPKDLDEPISFKEEYPKLVSLHEIPEIVIKKKQEQKNWSVQVGAFKSARQAYHTAKKVREKYNLRGKTFVRKAGRKGRILYLSRIKRLSQSQARKTCQALEENNKDCLVLGP